MTIYEGATLWARQTIESNVFFNKPDKWFKIWFYLVTKVNHKDSKQFKRGQCLMKYEWIQEGTGATKAQVDMFIRWAKKSQMLTTQKTTRGMIVSITNYDVFQTLSNYKNDTKNEMKTIRKRQDKQVCKNVSKTYTSDFEKFWSVYPKKINKKKSFETWQKMNGTRPSLDVVLKSVRGWTNSKDWKKDGGQFIPHPTTWLNGHRWEDEQIKISNDNDPSFW